jgi:hypothetical protein
VLVDESFMTSLDMMSQEVLGDRAYKNMVSIQRSLPIIDTRSICAIQRSFIDAFVEKVVFLCSL